MSISVFTIIAFLLFCYLQFFKIPNMEKRFQEDLSLDRLGLNIRLSLLSVIRGMALMFLIAGVGIIICMWLASLKGGASAQEVNQSLDQLKSWRSGIGKIGGAWGVFSIIAILLALVIHAYRSSKVKVENVFQKMYQKEYERLDKQFAEGKLDEMEIPDDLKEDYDKFHELRYIYENPDKIEWPEDVDKEATLANVDNDLSILYERIRENEIQRRINLTIKKSEAELPKPVTFWDKIQTFFISKGLMNNLGRTSRLFYSLGLILLLPSMLSMYSGSLENRISTNIVRLNNLQLSFSSEESKEQLNQLIGQFPDESYELDEEDEEVIEEVASLYESTLAEELLSGSNIDITTRVAYRGNVVKNEVLRKFKAKSNSVKQLDSGSKISDLSSREADLLKNSEEVIQKKKAPKIKGHNIREDLRRAAKKKPDLLKRLKRELADLQTPLKRRDLSRALVKQTINSTISGVDGDLGGFSERTMGEFDRRSVATLKETQANKFTTEVLNGQSLDDALKSTKASAEFSRIEPTMKSAMQDINLDNINSKLRDFPPSLKSNIEPHVKTSSASQRLERLSSRTPSGSRHLYADALADLDDYFPSQMAAETKTPRHNFRKSVSPSLPSISTGSNFSRARSFTKLRGFSRVGGVLIGHNEPKPGYIANYTDIDWNISNRTISFTLTEKGGKKYSSINYKIPIAYHALSFAADGRPLAVTMVSAQPMKELKILLHPTLIDSPMGKRIIDLDRFVDQFTGDDYRRQAATQLVFNHFAMYQFAWALQLRIVVAKIDKSEYDPESQMVIEQYAQVAERMIYSPELRQSVRQGLASRSFSDPQKSVVVCKPAFFDKSLVDGIVKVSDQTTNLTTFQNELHEYISRKVGFSIEQSLMERALSDPPEFNPWSGVRENKYTVAPENILMIRGQKAAMPLNFMEQISFDSAPAFVSSDADSYIDEKPWEFPHIRNHLHRQTLAGVRGDSQAKQILADATEFTYLQRLFRMGMNGYLGPDFPIEKLVDLMDDLEMKNPVKYYRTLRWNANYSAEVLETYLENEGMNQSEISEFLKIREELGITKDHNQQMNNMYSSLPSLY